MGACECVCVVCVCECVCVCVFVSVSLSMLGVVCMHILGFLHSRMPFFHPLPIHTWLRGQQISCTQSDANH